MIGANTLVASTGYVVKVRVVNYLGLEGSRVIKIETVGSVSPLVRLEKSVKEYLRY